MFRISDFYKELDKIYSENSGGSVMTFLKKELARARLLNDKDALLTVLNEKGSVHRVIGETDAALDCYEEVLIILKSLDFLGTELHANALINLGNTLITGKRYGDALYSFNEAERILKKLPNKSSYSLSAVYNNRSTVYREQGDLDKAGSDLKSAIKLLETLPGTESELLTGKINLAELFIKSGDMRQAENLLMLVIHEYEECTNGDDIHFSNALATMGELLFLKGDYKDSETYYERAIGFLEKKTGKTKMTELLEKNLKKVRLAGMKE